MKREEVNTNQGRNQRFKQGNNKKKKKKREKKKEKKKVAYSL